MIWSFYLACSGRLIGTSFSGPESALAANTPEGCIAIPGLHDHLSRRVEVRPDDFGNAYPVVVPWQPPAPPDDDLRTWAWDAATERWVSTPTTAAIARDARAERDRRMSAADWVTLRAMRTGQPIPADWAAYLQALADVPAQSGFPMTIIWPEAPNANP